MVIRKHSVLPIFRLTVFQNLVYLMIDIGATSVNFSGGGQNNKFGAFRFKARFVILFSYNYAIFMSPQRIEAAEAVLFFPKNQPSISTNLVCLIAVYCKYLLS